MGTLKQYGQLIRYRRRKKSARDAHFGFYHKCLLAAYTTLRNVRDVPPSASREANAKSLSTTIRTITRAGRARKPKPRSRSWWSLILRTVGIVTCPLC